MMMMMMMNNKIIFIISLIGTVIKIFTKELDEYQYVCEHVYIYAHKS